MGRARKKDRVAVGRGMRGGFRGDQLSTAAFVVDDDRLAEDLIEFRADKAADDVARAAGGIRNDHPDGARRKMRRLRTRDRMGAERRYAHGGSRAAQQSTTRTIDGHDVVVMLERLQFSFPCATQRLATFAEW